MQVAPGPALYKGKYEKPTGQAPVVKETGAYTGALETQYRQLSKKIEDAGLITLEFVNGAWEHYKPTDFSKFGDKIKEAGQSRVALQGEIDAFKAAVSKVVTKRFTA
jgi:hypothetical protein